MGDLTMAYTYPMPRFLATEYYIRILGLFYSTAHEAQHELTLNFLNSGTRSNRPLAGRSRQRDTLLGLAVPQTCDTYLPDPWMDCLSLGPKEF